MPPILEDAEMCAEAADEIERLRGAEKTVFLAGYDYAGTQRTNVSMSRHNAYAHWQALQEESGRGLRCPECSAYATDPEGCGYCA